MRQRRRATIQIYRGRNRQWFWRLRAANGKIIADGAEGYARTGNALRAAVGVLTVVRREPVVIQMQRSRKLVLA